MRTDRATSRRMARQRTRGTRPERVLADAIVAAGFVGAGSIRRNVKLLPGSPDVVVLVDGNEPGIAVFADGCFWHACPRHWRPPVRNRDFWLAKMRGNVARDRADARLLARMGWTVVRAWEHEILATGDAGIEGVVRRVREAFGRRRREVYERLLRAGMSQTAVARGALPAAPLTRPAPPV